MKILRMYNKELKRHFLKENTFWTDGYFVCSVGNISEKTLAKYIDTQG